MSIQKQFRRDTNTNLLSVIPALGEPAFDTTNKRLYMGDGSSYGGIPHVNYSDLIGEAFTYASTGGSANAYTLTLTKAPTSYAAGMRVKFKASFSNTASATINVNSLGAKTFKKTSGGALTTLASGDIVSGSIYEAVYDGTDFQLFGFEMAGTTPASKVLAVGTASSSSTLDFTGIINSTYNVYDFHLIDLRPATDSVSLYMRTSTDGGATYDATLGNYTWHGYSQALNAISTAETGEASGSSTAIYLNGNTLTIGNAAAEGLSGVVRIYNPLGTTRRKAITGYTQFDDPSTNQKKYRFDAFRDNTADIDAVRFLMSSGNITSGSIVCIGHRSAV